MPEVTLPGWGKVRTINVDGEEVVLDPQNLKFTDATLNQFFELVSGFCDYYGQKLADSSRAVAKAEQQFERLYIEKFKEFREAGKSEKTSELYAKAEEEVVRAKSTVVDALYKRDSIQNHLKAMNAARDDAHNRGHFLRKELDKINMDVRNTTYEMSRSEDTPGVPDEVKAEEQLPAPRPTRQPYRGHRDDPDMEALFQQVEAKKRG